jgi:hypothetical protein
MSMDKTKVMETIRTAGKYSVGYGMYRMEIDKEVVVPGK